MRNGDRRVTLHVTHVHASADLSLTWVARVTPVAGRRPIMTPINAWREAERRSLDATTVAGRAEAAPGTSTLERIFARERRVESTVLQADRPAGTQATDPHTRTPRAEATAPGRLHLVLRKSVVLVPSDPVRQRDDGVAATTGPATVSRIEPARALASQPQPLALSPSDLGRLADDVVRQIDRRATAYRERMGLV